MREFIECASVPHCNSLFGDRHSWDRCVWKREREGYRSTRTRHNFMTGNGKGAVSALRPDDADDRRIALIYRFDLTVTCNRMDGKANGRSRERSRTLDVSVTRDK
jgi:hypothetical protein